MRSPACNGFTPEHLEVVFHQESEGPTFADGTRPVLGWGLRGGL